MRRALLFVFLAGCTHQGPEATLAAYAQALRDGDVDRIRALSDSAYRAAHDRAELERFVAEHPDLVRHLAGNLESAGEVRAEVRLPDEERLILVREDGAWRVAFGGLEPFRADSPEASVLTFFRAVAAGRLAAIRAVMPAEAALSHADDAALLSHLDAMKPRIDAARAGLGPVVPGRAQIEDDRARLPYGEGRAVELVREEGRWKIVDLE